jgi:hypothetical protein
MAAIELYKTPLFYDSSLVAYYRFEANSNDSKGTNNGTDSGVSYNASYGKFGQGVLFSGGTNSILLSNNANLRFTKDMTVTGWFKTSTTGIDERIVQNYDYNGTEYGWAVRINNTNLYFTRYGLDDVNVGVVVTDGTWKFFAATCDSNGVSQLYLNGSPSGSPATANSNVTYLTPSYPCIGRRYNQSDSSFNGDLDDIALFNRALTAKEISNLYNGTWSSGFFAMM